MRSKKKVVYALQHNRTKKIYIGSSIDPAARFRAHMSLLRNGKHRIEDLQADYDKYGADFSLFILAEVDHRDCRGAEYEFIHKYKSHIRGVGYNYRDKVAICWAENPRIPYKDGLPELPEEV